MIYCSFCHKAMEICECDFRKEQPSQEQNKIVEPKKGTGKASKEIVEK